MRPALFLLLAAALAPAAEPKPADAPVVLYAVPLVPDLLPGKPAKFVLRGRKLDGVQEVVASDAAVKVQVIVARSVTVAKDRPKEREGETELELRLESLAAVSTALTLTAVGKDGARSAPFPVPAPFDGPRLAEKEPNDGFRRAQPLPLPGSVVGVIGNAKDVDVYRIEAKAGRTLRVRVECGRFGSPAEVRLQLYDGGGNVVATAAGPDPSAEVTPTADGPLFAALLDARDWGGAGYGYRLTVTADR